MASGRKGIFGGQHDENLTSLFNPTFLDDLAILVEGNTPESMFTALQVVKEVCEENALTLNMSAGKTEATVLIQCDKAKEVKRRLYAEVEEGAAILETPAAASRGGQLPSPGVPSRLHPYPERGVGGQTLHSSGNHSGLSVLCDQAIPTRVRTDVAKLTVHNRLLHQAGQRTSLSKAQREPLYMALLRRILDQHKLPEPGTHRMRDYEVLRVLKVPLMAAQLAVDKLRFRPLPWLSPPLVWSGGRSLFRRWCWWQRSPRPRESPHTREEFWNKWQRAALLRTHGGQGRRFRKRRRRTESLDEKQEWLCTRCGKRFPSQAACIGHQSSHSRDLVRSLAAGSQWPICRTEQFAGAAAATLAMWSTPLRTGSPRRRAANAPRGRS